MHERCFRMVIGLIWALLLPACAGTQRRGLILTEVGKREAELYFNEAAGRSVTLGDGYKLTVKSSTGTNATIGLGAGGTLTAGQFLVIWEEGGYRGPPVAQPYTQGQLPSVQGIKVRNDFFGDISDESGEVRLHGSRNRVSGLLVIFPLFTTDEVDDVVRFGLDVPARPVSGGTFQPNGSLASPAGSQSLQRRWSGNAPFDTDAELDWTRQFPSLGQATP